MKKNLANKSFEEIEKEFDIKLPSEKQIREFLRRKGRRGIDVLTPEKVKKNWRIVDNFFNSLGKRMKKEKKTPWSRRKAHSGFIPMPKPSEVFFLRSKRITNIKEFLETDREITQTRQSAVTEYCRFVEQIYKKWRRDILRAKILRLMKPQHTAGW